MASSSGSSSGVEQGNGKNKEVNSEDEVSTESERGSTRSVKRAPIKTNKALPPASNATPGPSNLNSTPFLPDILDASTPGFQPIASSSKHTQQSPPSSQKVKKASTAGKQKQVESDQSEEESIEGENALEVTEFKYFQGRMKEIKGDIKTLMEEYPIQVHIQDLNFAYQAALKRRGTFAIGSTEYSTPINLPSSYVDSTYWTPEEKSKFFFGLSRHSRHRPDLIATEIGTKTSFEVIDYLEWLKDVTEDLDEEKWGKPIIEGAREISDELLEKEESIADGVDAYIKSAERKKEIWEEIVKGGILPNREFPNPPPRPPSTDIDAQKSLPKKFGHSRRRMEGKYPTELKLPRDAILSELSPAYLITLGRKADVEGSGYHRPDSNNLGTKAIAKRKRLDKIAKSRDWDWKAFEPNTPYAPDSLRYAELAAMKVMRIVELGRNQLGETARDLDFVRIGRLIALVFPFFLKLRRYTDQLDRRMKEKGGAETINIEVLHSIHDLLKQFLRFMITEAVKIRTYKEDIGVHEQDTTLATPYLLEAIRRNRVAETEIKETKPRRYNGAGPVLGKKSLARQEKRQGKELFEQDVNDLDRAYEQQARKESALSSHWESLLVPVQTMDLDTDYELIKKNLFNHPIPIPLAANPTDSDLPAPPVTLDEIFPNGIPTTKNISEYTLFDYSDFDNTESESEDQYVMESSDRKERRDERIRLEKEMKEIARADYQLDRNLEEDLWGRHGLRFKSISAKNYSFTQEDYVADISDEDIRGRTRGRKSQKKETETERIVPPVVERKSKRKPEKELKGKVVKERAEVQEEEQQKDSIDEPRNRASQAREGHSSSPEPIPAQPILQKRTDNKRKRKDADDSTENLGSRVDESNLSVSRNTKAPPRKKIKKVPVKKPEVERPLPSANGEESPSGATTGKKRRKPSVAKGQPKYKSAEFVNSDSD